MDDDGVKKVRGSVWTWTLGRDINLIVRDTSTVQFKFLGNSITKKGAKPAQLFPLSP